MLNTGVVETSWELRTSQGGKALEVVWDRWGKVWHHERRLIQGEVRGSGGGVRKSVPGIHRLQKLQCVAKTLAKRKQQRRRCPALQCQGPSPSGGPRHEEARPDDAHPWNNNGILERELVADGGEMAIAGEQVLQEKGGAHGSWAVTKAVEISKSLQAPQAFLVLTDIMLEAIPVARAFLPATQRATEPLLL
eukprot:gene21334-28270_t